MSSPQPGAGWWQSSDGRWHPPQPNAVPIPVEPDLPRRRRGGSANWGCLAWAAALPILAGAVVLFLFAIGTFAEEAIEVDPGGFVVDGQPVADPAAVPRPAPACEEVRYYVFGSAPSVSITMANATGDTEQLADIPLPLRSTAGREGLGLGCLPPGAFLYISAQNQGETGDVNCQINRGDRIVAESRSFGAYVVATCSD